MGKAEIFAHNFKKYRKKRGISQKEFAEKLYESAGKKITLSSVSNYETGLHMPSPQILPAIADILEVSIDALFGIEEILPLEEEQEQGTITAGKQELEQLEKKIVVWKATHTNDAQEFAEPVEYCERLLGVAKKQQDELMILQSELASIREILTLLKG